MTHKRVLKFLMVLNSCGQFRFSNKQPAKVKIYLVAEYYIYIITFLQKLVVREE